MSIRTRIRVCYDRHTVRTTLNLNDEALLAAMEVCEGCTKTEVVNQALRHFARARRRRNLLDLRGKVEWVGEVDELRNRATAAEPHGERARDSSDRDSNAR